MAKFNQKAQEAMQYYVYALVDPRNDSIFYIGKGKGNRVYTHEENVRKLIKSGQTQNLSLKEQTICDILNIGKHVQHLIIRSCLTEEHALIVESTLIDLFTYISKGVGITTLTVSQIASLTNTMPGFLTQGVCDADDLCKYFSTTPLGNKALNGLKVLAINISIQSTNPKVIYNRVKGNWCVSPKKAENADLIFATHCGKVIGIYKKKGNTWNWQLAASNPNRYSFEGNIVTDSNIINKFMGKMIQRKAGSKNPILYIGKW